MFEAGLLLVTPLRALDAGIFLVRFGALFARVAGAAFFALDFVVFFTLVRAAIANSPRATAGARAANPYANSASSKQKAGFPATGSPESSAGEAKRLPLHD